MEKEMAQLLLPAGMLDHFEVVLVSREEDSKDKYPVIKIHLEERNNPPSGYVRGELESKGFYQAKQVQDFPIRGKRVFLSIKRRRWRLTSDKNQSISNDYSYLTQGTKMTRELSDFLKGTGGNPR